MSVSVGQKERETQKRAVKLFQKELKYDYLGFWKDREGNSNIEEGLLRKYLLEECGYTETIVTKALTELRKTAADSTKTLYDRNSAVYELLRYGVKVREGVGDYTETVWLINWKEPHKNQFAIAEEVTVAPANPQAHGKRPDIVLYVTVLPWGYWN